MEDKKPNVEEEYFEEEEYFDESDFEEEEDVSSQTDNGENDESDSKVKTNKSKSDEELEKAKNAHFAKLRREKEAREKEAKEKQQKEREQKIKEAAKLEGELGMVKTNPYTDQPIVDEEDLKIYKLQRELDNEGKDPIADLPNRIAEENRKVAKKVAEEEAAKKKADEERQSKIESEIRELREKYPKVNTGKLAEDPLFIECLKGKAGRWSQVEIYEYYLGKKAEADKKAADEKMDKTANKMSRTPSSNSKGKISASDISGMSDEEFDKFWNENYS